MKTKSVFLVMMIFGTLITISSNNWISMWMGLELNMMSFIPLIYKKSSKSSEAGMMYFLIQSMSSMILMFSLLMMNMWTDQMKYFIWLIGMSLLIKLGAAPFHMWLPEMLTKLNWVSCFILLTWQKLAPMMMINNLNYNNMIMMLSIITSVIMGAIGGLNQTSLRKIMGYSSINHLGWMLSMSKMQNKWIIYLIIYSMITLMICMMLNNYNLYYINQINMINLSMTEKLSFTMNMLSLGGLPPFLGFLSKWIVINTLMEDKMIFMLIIMVMTSMITLFYYMRMISMMMLSFQSVNKWMIINNNNNYPMYMMMINMSLPFYMILNFM
uniref:NADH-ubiquinone oxidoreductase chain 2 n=1 Tax=Coridius brunneus TaxID=696877 RepID=A0A8E7EQQ6_9HEMI|nr:NADH dehydrogenase subunit 2 [Coridius brunneus]